MRVIVLNVFFPPFRCCFSPFFSFFFTNKNKPITKSISEYEVLASSKGNEPRGTARGRRGGDACLHDG